MFLFSLLFLLVFLTFYFLFLVIILHLFTFIFYYMYIYFIYLCFFCLFAIGVWVYPPRVVSNILLFFLIYLLLFLIYYIFSLFIIVLLTIFFFLHPFLVGTWFMGHSTGLSPVMTVLIWTAEVTENVRPQGILIRVRYHRSPHFNTKTWLYSTACKLHCWKAQAKEVVKQKHYTTHQKKQTNK